MSFASSVSFADSVARFYRFSVCSLLVANRSDQSGLLVVPGSVHLMYSHIELLLQAASPDLPPG